MNSKTLFVICCLLLAGCVQPTPQPTDGMQPETPNMPNPASVYCTLEIRTVNDGSQTGVCIFPDGSECEEWAYYRGECKPITLETLPNPASAFCEQQGNTHEIRTASDSSQAGICIFPDGSECDEWAYFRGECIPTSVETPTGSSEDDLNGWKIYANDALGYSFHYPAEAQVTTNDEPLKSLFISGPGMGAETWGIAHPSDRDEYRPPEGADLLQWLTDHNLLGETHLPDEQIAGTTAIHFRHDRSPQSYASDLYFFARSGQLYLVTIGHSSDIEDWDLNHRFLQSFQFIETTSDNPAPTVIPTALPVDPLAYQDWNTFTHPVYNFSVRLPDDWIVEEVTTGDPLMVGHELNLHPIVDSEKENIRLTFRRVGEEIPLWPTGVGQGEFFPQGTLDIAEQPASRILLVCPTGEVTSIWYHATDSQPNLIRGDLEFGFIFSTIGHCEPGYRLSGEVQLVGEMIIASLNVP
jgi:putative hemolysin